MSYQSFGFIGGGRITQLLLFGLRKGWIHPKRIVISDPSTEELAKLGFMFPRLLNPFITTVRNGNDRAACQNIVFLAVHPPTIPAVAAQIKDSLLPDSILVSLAPKFTIAKLTELLGGFSRIVRMIPNAPSIVNAGFNPATFSPTLSAIEKREVTNLLACWGDCPEVAEHKLEAYAILTAMGPTYLWFQFYALLQTAEACGLTAEEAGIGLESMVLGALKTMNVAGLEPDEVQDLVPVKPLAELEPQLIEQYRSRLTAVFEKIKP